MLLSNVMLVPGMNTFIEPKHTLQVATPTPMLLEQRNTVIALSSRSLSKDKRLSNLTYRRKGVFCGVFSALTLRGGSSEETDIENCVLRVDVLCG